MTSAETVSTTQTAYAYPATAVDTSSPRGRHLVASRRPATALAVVTTPRADTASTVLRATRGTPSPTAAPLQVSVPGRVMVGVGRGAEL